MTTTAIEPPANPSLPFTVRDLEGMPNDGRRYELVDGTLVVSPAPGRLHQKLGLNLYGVLNVACPEEFDVLAAPFAVRFPDDEKNEVQPDVLVGRFEDFTDKDLPAVPVLAVEVLSPGAALYDLNLKRALYEREGVPSYWVIDPDVPWLRVFELGEDGRYQLTAKVAGDEPFDAVRPFPVRIVLSELLGRLAR